MKKNTSIATQYFRHLTPRGEGGISTFLIQSQNIEPFILNFFQSFNGKAPIFEIGRFCYGKLFDQNKELIDEIILSIQNENQIEIHSHGGNISTREIIRFLESNNFQQMQEFDFQQIDSYYHFNHALKNITTINEYEFLKNQIKNIILIKEKAEFLTSDELILILKKMLIGWGHEKNNRRRASICLAGLPNAGKSSLINAITGKKRSLVSSQAKTTRDTVTEDFQTRGFRIKIIDTAGLHQPDNYLDTESVKQTILNIEKAEIILWLHDSSLPFTSEEQLLLKNIRFNHNSKPIWLILTKTDIKTKTPLIQDITPFKEKRLISSNTGEGLENLLDDLIHFLFPQANDPKQLTALSEQMAIEIADFLQKVDLQPAKHRMVAEFFNQRIKSIPV